MIIMGNCCKTNCTCNKCCSNIPLRYTGPNVPEVGLITGMLMDDAINILGEFVSDINFADGVGIESVTDNGDGTFTFNFTDGTTFTTPDLTGPTGSQGIAGPQGFSSTWLFQTATIAPPSSTFLRLNHASFLSTTKIFINNTNSNSIALPNFLDSFRNESIALSGSVPKYGIIKLFDTVDLETYVSFEIVNITNQVGYTEYDVIFMQSNGSFTANDLIGVSFVPSEEILKTFIYPISNWDMDTNNLFNFVHGLADYNDIADVSVLIKDDVGAANFPLNTFDGTSVQGGVYQIDATNITLFRLTGGLFDDTAFSSTGDRGYITIKYLK